MFSICLIYFFIFPIIFGIDSELLKDLPVDRDRRVSNHSRVMGRFPTPTVPGEKVIINFTDMGTEQRVGGMRYLPVLVDKFSDWVEASPTKKEDSSLVTKILMKDWIP